jgi:hypothetical protein
LDFGTELVFIFAYLLPRLPSRLALLAFLVLLRQALLFFLQSLTEISPVFGIEYPSGNLEEKWHFFSSGKVFRSLSLRIFKGISSFF